MKLIDTETKFTEHHTIVREADVVDATDIPSETGRSRWVPRHVRIVWQRERVRGEEWGPWTTAGAVVMGPRLKVNGEISNGMQYSQRHIYEDHPMLGSWVRSTRPNPHLP